MGQSSSFAGTPGQSSPPSREGRFGAASPGRAEHLGQAEAGSVAAAFLGAIAFAFAPVVIVRLAHVQLLMTLGLPLALLAFHRFVERQTALRTAALSGALVVSALCSGYYGIAAGVAVGLGFVYYGVTRGLWRQPRYLAACAAAMLLAALLVLPFFLPYLQLEAGGAAFRSIDETRRYSADWRAYLTSTAHVQQRLLGWLVPFDRTAFPERILFPGFVVCTLALVAVVRADRGRDVAAGLQACPSTCRETVGFYTLLALVGAWLSFGPAAGLYWLAYKLVPGFSLTRAPARLGILVVLALSMLASIGLATLVASLERRDQSSHPPRRRIDLPPLVAAVATTLLIVELSAVPLDLRNALPMPAAHRALAPLPAGAVAEFPYFYLERDLYRNSLYMLYSTAHWHPLVNGYSDVIPEDYRQTVVAISTFPSREAFRLLRERGARYAIFHLNLYDRRSREKLIDAIGRYQDYLRPLAQDGDVRLYEIVRWPR